MSKVVKLDEKRPLVVYDKVFETPELAVWDKICELVEVINRVERWEINQSTKCDEIFPGYQNLGEMYEVLLEIAKNNEI